MILVFRHIFLYACLLGARRILNAQRVSCVNDGSTYVGFFRSKKQPKSAAVIFYLNTYPLREISRRDRARKHRTRAERAKCRLAFQMGKSPVKILSMRQHEFTELIHNS